MTTPLLVPPDWKSWPIEKKKKLRRRLAAERARRNMRQWRQLARYKQLPPDDMRHGLPQIINDRPIKPCQCRAGEGWHYTDGDVWRRADEFTAWSPDTDWLVWLIMSGRGFGKTWVGASWIVEQALKNPGTEWAIVAPTFSDTRRICIEGTTGVLRALEPGELENYRRNDLEITLTNKSKIYGFSADRPDRVRGSNLSGAWCDELGSWRYEATWHEGLMPALRIGEKPRVMVTTTPRGTELLRELVERPDGTVHITQGSTWENESNLSAVALGELRRRYGGTRLGMQELEGELIADVEGALWRRVWLDDHRIVPTVMADGTIVMPKLPDFQRIVVGIDPATTSKKESAYTGIIVAALGTDGHFYVLEDLSEKLTPGSAMKRAIQAYYAWNADRIVCEVNNGGDFVEELLRTYDENVPYRSVHASRGKQVRAEPVSAVYEQGRAHHVGTFAKLESQLCSWTPLDKDSPDRLDALVWVATDLIVGVDWTQLYGGAYTCPRCDRMSILMKDRPNCPHCQEPIDKELVEAA